MQITDDELTKLLEDSGVITAEKIAAIKAKYPKGTSLYQILFDEEVVSDENLGKLISDHLKLPFVYLAKTPVDAQIFPIIPEVVARKWKIFAFGKDKDGLKLAVADPANKEIVSFIEKKAGEKVVVYLATEKDIDKALGFYKKDLQKSFDELLAEKVSEAKNSVDNEAPVTKIVDLLISYAYDNRASDIHIEPEKDDSLVRFRIDGILHDVLRFPKILHEQIISRIKVTAKLKTDEHMSAQDGKMQLTLPEEDLDVRVSIVPITRGEKAVLRLLSSKSRQFSLADLGMGEADLNKIKEAFSKPYGMILSTGPTGCGKTTTIYSILKIINTRDVNIATIEDPVEYDIGGINQIQVNAKTNLTFADGLRSILRQDPNVVFVGEIRDAETANIAVNAATTGHLVLSTLHTNNAATTLPRLIDMDVEPFLVASTVNVIVGQRLIRKICEKCRESTNLTLADLTKQIPPKIIEKVFGQKTEVQVYAGKGCPVCHQTGYTGRIGVFEVLVMVPELKELVAAKATAGVIMEKAVSLGMTTMLEDGLTKVAAGITTIEEILRVSKE